MGDVEMGFDILYSFVQQWRCRIDTQGCSYRLFQLRRFLVKDSVVFDLGSPIYLDGICSRGCL